MIDTLLEKRSSNHPYFSLRVILLLLSALAVGLIASSAVLSL